MLSRLNVRLLADMTIADTRSCKNSATYSVGRWNADENSLLNRIIASEGLKRLSNGNQRIGIKALLKVSSHKPFLPVTIADVAFKLAPRLNASGRLSSAEKSLRLLTNDNYFECKLLAEELEAENRQRQELCSLL